MKRKVFKAAYLVIAVAFMVSVISACGKASTESGTMATGSDGATSSTGTPAKSGEVVNIQMSMWDAVNEQYNFIKDFNDTHPEIKLEAVTIPTDYSKKLTAMLASNSAPDIIIAWECDFFRFAKEGAIIPLDDYINKTGTFSTDDLVPGVQKMNSLNGACYGLPWCFATEILFYNVDMFDAANVKYPDDTWTWDTYLETAQKLTKVENGKTVQYGCNAVSGSNWFAMIGAAGDEIVDKDGNLVLGEGTKRTLQYMNDLTNKYKVCPQPQASTDTTDLFAAGKVAMTRTGSWMCSVYRDLKDFKWDVASFPKDNTMYTSMHTGLFTINNQSKNKDAAWKVIDYMIGDRGQELICKAYSNLSARKSILAKGYHKQAGDKGPTNWAALDVSAENSYIGYVLLNSGLSTIVGQKFDSVMMGQKDIDSAISESLAESKKVQN